MKKIILIFFLLPLLINAQKNQTITAEDIVNRIKKQVNCPWADKTVDTFKAGNPDDKVTGIVTCMFANMAVLQKAVALNCNLIITHEPVFYNHFDETDAFDNDPVYKEKREFIDQNKLIVFRFHDHIHRTQPDGIYEGMLNKLGWKKYAVNNSQTLFSFPEFSLLDFAQTLKKELEMKTIRVIGNPEMKFSKVGFAAGAPGGSTHISMLQNPEMEVLVAGEAPEWETYLYANDAVQQNRNKAVVFLGHIKSEEAGMHYCAGWLKEFIPEIPIHFIENQANYSDL